MAIVSQQTVKNVNERKETEKIFQKWLKDGIFGYFKILL